MSVITISRGSHSHGKAIAEKVAKELGYECISREVLLEASSEFNVSEFKLLHALRDRQSRDRRARRQHAAGGGPATGDRRAHVVLVRGVATEYELHGLFAEGQGQSDAWIALDDVRIVPDDTVCRRRTVFRDGGHRA